MDVPGRCRATRRLRDSLNEQRLYYAFSPYSFLLAFPPARLRDFLASDEQDDVLSPPIHPSLASRVILPPSVQLH